MGFDQKEMQSFEIYEMVVFRKETCQHGSFVYVCRITPEYKNGKIS
jgi:hypothetical protein